MPRALFEKTGDAVYISHLDLMRLFQRAFKRAGLALKHTQGYNPRPSVSIALPLSLGVESRCELLDFELEGASVSSEQILKGLNASLISGVRVLAVYEDMRKLKHLAYLDCVLTLEYDNGIPADGKEQLERLFRRDSLPVEKKGKNGTVEQDILPMIKQLSITQKDGQELLICARVCCQNPTLNPLLISAAVSKYLPALSPDFVRCSRVEIYDQEENVFR